MNILFYSPVDLRAGLGCERWHCDVTNSLTKQFGMNVKIITGNLGYKRWTDKYLSSQLGIVQYERLNYLNIMASLFPTPAVLWKLVKAFWWADRVHFINGFMGQDILMIILKYLTQKKVYVGHHAPMFHTSKFHNWYMQNISRHILPMFDGHMTLNARDKQILRKWGAKNIYFIPSGVRVEKFISLNRTSHSGLNFFSVGRYDTPQKGFDLSIEAIRAFNQKYPNNKCTFRFAGSGGLGLNIDNKDKNIIDLGFLEYEEMTKYYQKSDVFLLSSREEPFGLILIEAWASGIPVLATKTEGPMDMLKENKNGWFVENISSEGIYNGIEKTYKMWQKNNDCFKKLEKNCRETGRMYSIDVTAAKMQKNIFSS